MSRKKEITDILIEDLSSTGKGVARENGRVIFAPHVFPGDRVDLLVTRKKKAFSEARVTAIREKSSKRTHAPCTYAGLCGGCKWQELQYGEQLHYKEGQVIENLKRIGKVEGAEFAAILPSEEEFFYRNKLEFTFSNNRWFTSEEIEEGGNLERNGLGFHMPGQFDKVLDIEKCWLQGSKSNEIRNFVRKYSLQHHLSFYDIRNNRGLLRNLVIRTSTTGDLMVILQTGENDRTAIEDLLNALRGEFSEITSLFYIVNEKKNDSYGDLDPVHFNGEAWITEKMTDPQKGREILFRIGPKSFYQTNSKQAEKLYRLAWEMAGLSGSELVYDLYTGTGTIANYIASSCRQVIGIEYVEEAVEDARINARENGNNHLEFYAGDMKDLLTRSFIDKHGSPEVIITDPPRAGMHEDVTRQILEIYPEKIVYVSCNPATQARDIQILSSRYAVEKVQPVDMFPHTPHVENIALLKRI